nr:alpha-mannosidase I MNS5 [Ipomoea batatas]
MRKGVVICMLIFLSTFFQMSFSGFHPPNPNSMAARRKRMSQKVRKMFYHAYENYMMHAFPHDELKPLTKTYTDSLSELGNLKLEHLPQQYSGSALTLIESLSSLVILGNHTEFEKAVHWLSVNLSFDVDARINLFECNIRVLGGLVSAHILATDSTNRLVQGTYKNQLLDLAEDLGRRFLPAFDTPTGLPYAWINLKVTYVPSNDMQNCATSFFRRNALLILKPWTTWHEIASASNI